MSCYFCTHWVEGPRPEPGPDEDWVSAWKRQTGECALHPQRLKTTAHYYCSQLRMKDPSLPIYWRLESHNDYKKYQKLREELKHAKARKKVLNATVRELRAKISAVEKKRGAA